jgi:putative hydrolase of the HAD superfamily
MNIVFDFGNVLMEWNPARLIEQHYPQSRRLVESSRTSATPPAPDALAAALSNHQDWFDFDRGLIDTATVANRSAKRLGLAAVDLQAFITRIPHVLPMLDDALSLMQALANGQHGSHRVLYLSNMPTEFAEVLEARCPWIARFEAGIFSGRVNLIKPDAEIYEVAEQRLNLDPAQTLFLDDSAPNVAAARARGSLAEIIDGPAAVRNALLKHGVLLTS